MQDLEGFRIRIGKLAEPIKLSVAKSIKLVSAKSVEKEDRVIPIVLKN
ncbi:MAG: hypothetical protein SVM86_04100 [Candidatus Cloacimonadota bacterium]|nr:hypothetical protein [Candidatus Cloacimonadota bacterium]